jgi:hypothetical protein
MRDRLPEVQAGLRILNPQGKEVEDYKEDYEKKPRLRYTSMRAHQEKAAQALAVGATQKLAASYANISERQVKKYYADPDFRGRIEELRTILGSRITGRVMKEIERRVTGTVIKNQTTMDLLRILDRLTQGGKGMNINIAGDVNVSNKYENILNALFNSDAGEDVSDFPQYGDRGLTIPGSSTPLERTVPRLQRGEADREE